METLFKRIWELNLPNDDAGSYFVEGQKAYIFGLCEWKVGRIVCRDDGAGPMGNYGRFHIYCEDDILRIYAPAWAFGAEKA